MRNLWQMADGLKGLVCCSSYDDVSDFHKCKPLQKDGEQDVSLRKLSVDSSQNPRSSSQLLKEN